MPRNNQLALPSARSPVPQNMTGFNSYTGQLAVTVQDTNPNTQWPGDGEYMEAFKRNTIYVKRLSVVIVLLLPVED
jgi:hypothetical protein